MDGSELQNANPTILSTAQLPSRRQQKLAAGSKKGPEFAFDHIIHGYDEDSSSNSDFTEEPIDEQEIYDLISVISDPEHPHTLGQLSVVNLPDISLDPAPRRFTFDERDEEARRQITRVLIDLTPTVNHCSLATVIGLAVRVRLERTLPPNYRVDVRIKPGSHDQDDQVNKQLADKERVAAALENGTLSGVLDKMLETCKTAR